MKWGRRLSLFALAFSCALLVTGPPASALDPQSFAEVSSGVVKVRAHCPEGTVLGSGFLVGSSVVMTAHHVVAGCRGVAVLAKGKWVNVAAIRSWRDGNQNLDVSTMKLAHPVNEAWVFSLRTSQVPIHAYVAALGYPLGEGISYTNGRVVGRVRGHIALRILAAQGYSGGPVVDQSGRVAGLVNLGLMAAGAFTGAGVGDNIFAYDISSRWGGWRRALCHAYPNGGIEDCPGGGSSSGGAGAPSSSPPASPPPATTPPTPPPAPAAAPSGFVQWIGAGTYQPGTVWVQGAAASCIPLSGSSGCWGENVYTTIGCHSGLFVDVDITDANGSLVDTGIDEAPVDLPNQVVLLQGSSFSPSAAQFRVTEINCFNL
jgi:hypothetical protein